jgi:hypothetical protein
MSLAEQDNSKTDYPVSAILLIAPREFGRCGRSAVWVVGEAWAIGGREVLGELRAISLYLIDFN